MNYLPYLKSTNNFQRYNVNSGFLAAEHRLLFKLQPAPSIVPTIYSIFIRVTEGWTSTNHISSCVSCHGVKPMNKKLTETLRVKWYVSVQRNDG